MTQKEIFFSVDIEATGSVPGIHSMYEIGACDVADDRRTFEAQLKLLSDRHEPEALAACGRTLEELRAKGDDPAAVMRRFGDWVRAVAGADRPVFVAFNAPYDWMFVQWYFHAFLGGSPFGASALCIKAYYMGMMDCSWSETSLSRIDPRFLSDLPHTHRALDDALQQADMFRRMRASDRRRP